MNRKTFVVILVIQFVLMGLFLIYGLVQRTQAIRNEELAKRATVEAMSERDHAAAIEAAFRKELEACMTRK
jgi:hypothetical protein